MLIVTSLLKPDTAALPPRQHHVRRPTTATALKHQRNRWCRCPCCDGSVACAALVPCCPRCTGVCALAVAAMTAAAGGTSASRDVVAVRALCHADGPPDLPLEPRALTQPASWGAGFVCGHSLRRRRGQACSSWPQACLSWPRSEAGLFIVASWEGSSSLHNKKILFCKILKCSFARKIGGSRLRTARTRWGWQL
jgi:hypothetical protein